MSAATRINPRLASLTEAGVSVWLDQIDRTLLAGDLARMVAQDCLRGVTSNPSIFEKAILGTPDYREEIRAMALAGYDAEATYDALAIADVQRAADTLAGVHEETGARDGSCRLRWRPTSHATPTARSRRRGATGTPSTAPT
jgi:transaldolase/glucose-6-phosphate isomerase